MRTIKDPQEYLQEWEKQHNPFYPGEMRWDRLQVNRFLKDWKQQLTLTDVVGQSEQLFCDNCGKDMFGTTISGGKICRNCGKPKEKI